MTQLDARNPFPGAACLHVEETGSTMDEARKLARLGMPTGTVIVAERQSAGRGRLEGRTWRSGPGEGLLATLVLDAESLRLGGLTIRLGLALCRAARLFGLEAERGFRLAPALKWPNDLLAGGRKLGGLLCEAAEGRVFAGFGINVTGAPPGEGGKPEPVSLAEALEAGALPLPGRVRLLELVLDQVSHVLAEEEWRAEAEKLLWRRGEEVDFAQGHPASGRRLRGRIEGLDGNGALLLRPPGASRPLALDSGEVLS